ncbi:MAG TPA: nitronate monooxygenase [Acidimicrobiales bacterium]|jgi:enoyl-[acyl-carrier protein] reductase II|nr:nitronate monooxygenase [Acidimicrobiales bacterium]
MSEPSGGRVADLLGVRIPIIQAPMTFIAGARLAAAVSEAGGLGIIETTSPQGRDDLKRVRDMTDRPVGANLALAMRKDPTIIDLLVETGVRVVTTSAGDPALFADRLHDAGITVFHVVGTLRNAMKAVDAGVDGLVVEGVEGGGFKNPNGASTMVLLPMVASGVDIPVISAGGICDARSMAAAFVLGAEGVQMGTRMLASRESPVHQNFKDSVVAADDTGTVLLSLPGHPTMRVIRTATAEQAKAEGRSEKALEAVLELYFGGDMQAALANTGQVAGRIAEVESVADIVRETWNGCRQILQGAPGLVP